MPKIFSSDATRCSVLGVQVGLQLGLGEAVGWPASRVDDNTDLNLFWSIWFDTSEMIDDSGGEPVTHASGAGCRVDFTTHPPGPGGCASGPTST